MNYSLHMSTSRRHNMFIPQLYFSIRSLLGRKVHAFHEEIPLCYEGNLKSICRLTEPPAEEELFAGMEYVQPDFFLFHKNLFQFNEAETRVVGSPDLIIEIWSPGNTLLERQKKLELYSTSSVTEHWYIDQCSNYISRYFGNKFLGEISICNKLYTQGGLMFDLSALAI